MSSSDSVLNRTILLTAKVNIQTQEGAHLKSSPTEKPSLLKQQRSERTPVQERARQNLPRIESESGTYHLKTKMA